VARDPADLAPGDPATLRYDAPLPGFDPARADPGLASSSIHPPVAWVPTDIAASS